MKTGLKILGLIPARGGSKGVPRKNIKLLAGKPLLAYTAEPALKVKSFSKVLLSTDDEEIAEVGRQLGLDVPFLRPAELAQDNTPTLPVVQHALQFMKGMGEEFDAVCILQATNPLRNVEDMEKAIEKFEIQGYDSLFSMLEVPSEHNPYWAFLENEEGLLHLATGGTNPIPRRQSLPKAYHREGSIYLCKTAVVLERNSLFGDKVGGYLMKMECPINIDTMEDWAIAEEYFKNLE
jgi:CMP-N,N'-diacetyllegionaminic acid synthase